MSNDTRTLTVSLVAKSELFKRGLTDAQKSMKNFNNSMLKSARQLGVISAKVALSLGAVGTATTAVIAKIGSDFESSVNKSFAIMGDLSDKTKRDMSRTAVETSKAVTFSAKEIAEGYFFLASAGLDAQQSMKALPQVARFAQAGMFDLGVATELAADSQSALGLKSSDAEANLTNLTRVTDVLVKANTIANATVLQFSESLTNKAGASLRFLGKEMEEGVAVLAAFADQGIKGQLAGERLSLILQQLPRVARENADAFRYYGIQVFDSTGNMMNMAQIAGSVERALGGMSAEQKGIVLAQLGMTEALAEGVKGLIGSSEAIANYQEQLGQAAGFTEAVANKQLDTFAAKIQLIINRLSAVAISIYDLVAPAIKSELLPIIDELITNLEGMDIAEWFLPMIDSVVVGIQRAVKTMGLFVAIWHTLKSVALTVVASMAAGLEFNKRIIEVALLGVSRGFMNMVGAIADGIDFVVSKAKAVGDAIGVDIVGDFSAKGSVQPMIDDIVRRSKDANAALGTSVFDNPFIDSLRNDAIAAGEDATKAWKAFGLGEDTATTRAIGSAWQNVRDAIGQAFDDEPMDNMVKKAEEIKSNFEEIVPVMDLMPDQFKDVADQVKDDIANENKDPGQFKQMRISELGGAIGGVFGGLGGMSQGGSFAMQSAAAAGNARTGGDPSIPLLSDIKAAAQMIVQNTRNGMVAVAG
jgi:TP901 family phage tail tape measure protein